MCPEPKGFTGHVNATVCLKVKAFPEGNVTFVVEKGFLHS